MRRVADVSAGSLWVVLFMVISLCLSKLWQSTAAAGAVLLFQSFRLVLRIGEEMCRGIRRAAGAAAQGGRPGGGEAPKTR